MNSGHQQQQRESRQAKHAYRIYRDLGPNRCLAAAWRVFRETPSIGTSRGRPRLADAKAGPPSGQWTKWCIRFHWVERAAEYDARVDAEKCATRQEQTREQERQRFNAELEAQEQLEETVWRLEAQLDTMDSLPVTGSSVWEREAVGRKVTAQKKHVQSVNLHVYARHLQAVNEIACWAIVGFEPTNQRSRTSDDDFNTPADVPGAGTGRMPGESAAAYRAFCIYRDLGTKRSLVAARMADRPTSEPATRASAGHWRGWSSKWNWVARAKAHDTLATFIERQTERYRRQQLEQRRFEFEMANQDRLESRIAKTGVLISRAAAAPVVDITQWITTRTGNRVHKVKTHIEGLDVGGFSCVANRYCDSMRLAVNRASDLKPYRRTGGSL
jgi:hypothetical protein